MGNPGSATAKHDKILYHYESQNYKEFGRAENLGQRSTIFDIIIAVPHKLMMQIPFILSIEHKNIETENIHTSHLLLQSEVQ